MTEILKQSNLKVTKNREYVLSIIEKHSLPLSAEEIYKKCLNKKVNINLSTIYRTLNTLTENKILIKNVNQDGINYYQLNTHKHKHLLVCEFCGKKIPLDICPLEKMLEQVSKDNNFEITSHNIELYGKCSKCLTL